MSNIKLPRMFIMESDVLMFQDAYFNKLCNTKSNGNVEMFSFKQPK